MANYRMDAVEWKGKQGRFEVVWGGDPGQTCFYFRPVGTWGMEDIGICSSWGLSRKGLAPVDVCNFSQSRLRELADEIMELFKW